MERVSISQVEDDLQEIHGMMIHIHRKGGIRDIRFDGCSYDVERRVNYKGVGSVFSDIF